MSTTHKTRTRRAWQPLHLALDRHIAPFLPAKLVLAISGGPDSRAMLEAVASWPKRNRGQWLVISIDHAVRPQASWEASLVVARAKRLGFDAEIIKLAAKAKENEQSLREKRYEALSQASLSFGSSIVCCAHHRDDNAEGFLMALFGVGGGALGAAMASYEKINGLSILRPFVELSKEELRLPLSLSGYTDFVVDNFDQELVGQRAFLRHMVLPKLSHFKPNISERLNHFAKEERYSKEALLKQALPMIDWCENGAKVVLAKDSDPVLLKVALKHILNKMSSNLDLRQCRPTLEKMITHSLAGLDRAPKLFILNDLNAKVYKLPGALAYANGKEILVRRV